jgi:HlyD family secretion protein
MGRSSVEPTEGTVPKKSNALKIVILVVVLLVVVIATLYYLRESRVPQEIVLAGTLEARTVEVGSLVGGRVARVHVDEGVPVEAGQLLVELETETIDRQLAEQQAAIGAARAELAKAIAGPRPVEIAKAATVAENDERERGRMASLYRQGIVSKETLDAAVTKAKASADDLRLLQLGTRKEDIDAQRAQLEQQERRLATLLKQRAECNVTSSVSGVVQSFGLRPGDLVAANQTVAEILESSQLWVRVFVPETELYLVKVGRSVKVSVDSVPQQWFAGHVVSTNPQGEYTPRNVQTPSQRADQVYGVKVFVDPNPALKAGMAAQVDLGVKGRPK